MALRRYHRATIVLVTLGVLAASCASCSSAVHLDSNGIPVGSISAKWVEESALAHLYFPGSKPFYQLDSGSNESPGSSPAYAGAILTSDATGAQIYSWYIAKLRSLGWGFVTDKGCEDIQPSCPQFGHNGHGQRETLYLAIDDPALLPGVIGKSPPAACTVYEMSYEVFPPGGLRIPAPMRWNGGNQCWWTGTRWQTPSDVP
jgi:hypothetical protein